VRPNLTVLRAALNALLTDTATIHRNTGRVEQNEDTGLEEPVFDLVYTGPVLVQPLRATEVGIGGVELVLGRYDVTLPAETDAATGDKLTVISSAGDTTLTGQTLSLTDVPADSYQVARFCKAERST
jgi:hypothetical protein